MKTNRPVEMVFRSNIPDTSIYHREQKYGLAPDEGWIFGGRGTEIPVQLFDGGRYEIRAVAEGYNEKQQRFHEPSRQYSFIFYEADRIVKPGAVSQNPLLSSHGVSSLNQTIPASSPISTISEPSATRHRNTWAIVIGVSDYKYSQDGNISSLAFAKKDAQDFYQKLLMLGWPRDNIYKLTDQEANKRNIEYAFETWLRRANRQDMVVVYWSSHAWPDPGDPTKAYFACYDSKISDPSSGWRMDRVRQMLEEREAQNLVFIADACHAGKIIRAGDPKAIGVVPALESMQQAQAIPSGWIYIASADPDRKAYEDKAWSNGALTHVLLEGLSGKADGYQSLGAKDGIITMGELRGYITDRMAEETLSVLGARLTPLFYTTSGDPGIWNISLCKETR